MTQRNRKLPGEADAAAAFILADVTRPDGSYTPEDVSPDYAAQMAAAGVVPEDTNYILRSMVRRALILERQWLQLMHDISQSSNPSSTMMLTRAASHMQKDLMATQGAIYKIRLDLHMGFEPIITRQDQALADDARAMKHSQGQQRLATRQIVMAEMQADYIVDAGFGVAVEKKMRTGAE